MKLKDITEKLKKEHGDVRVPDVLERARKAPVNKLLTGETPVQAFRKSMAIRLLTMVLILLLAVAITLSAMWLTDEARAAKGCYVRIEIIRSVGGSERYAITAKGLIADGYFIEDVHNEVAPKKLDISSISELYEAKSGDKVRIYVACDDQELRRQWGATATSELGALYMGEVSLDEIKSSDSSSVKFWLASYINSFDPNAKASVNDSMDALLSAYCGCAEES